MTTEETPIFVLQKMVVKLRQEVPQYVQKKNEQTNDRILKYVDGIKFTDQGAVLPESPKVPALDVPNFDWRAQRLEEMELKVKLKKQIKLMQIKEQMNNCPISKIIENL